jgi:O-antigen/teichoic acid export membrane protein
MTLGLLIVPFLIAKLGKDAFGLTVLTESTIAFFEILTTSIRIAMSRHATFSLSQGKMSEFIEYLSCGRYLLGFCGIFVLAVGCTISYFLPHIFQIPEALTMQSRILFFMVTIAFYLSVPNIVYWVVIYAHQRFDLIFMACSSGVILRAIAIFALFTFLPSSFVSLATYGLIYFVMKVLENSLIYFWHKKVMPGFHLITKNIRLDKMPEIISFSGYTSLYNISMVLYDNTANILINIFYGPSVNAMYAVSLKIPTAIKNFFMRATWTLNPTVTELAAKGDLVKMEQLFLSYSKLVSILTVPLCLFLMFVSRQLINLWVGKDFGQAAILLCIHILPLIFVIPLEAINGATNAYAKVKVPSQVGFASAVCNVILGIILAKTFSLGLYGFAISAATFTFINGAVFIPYYSCKITGISLKKYWLNAFVYPFLLAMTILGLGLAIKILFLSTSTRISSLDFIWEGSFLTLVYFLCAYFVLLNPLEKEIFNVFKIKLFNLKLSI